MSDEQHSGEQDRWSLTPPTTPEDDTAVRVYPTTFKHLNGSIIEITVLGATERERDNVVEAILLTVNCMLDKHPNRREHADAQVL